MERLRVILAIVDTGSFAGAAERLGVSSSAVSQSVRRLEADLGRPLLRRTSRSVRPTADGLALVERARMIEAILADTVSCFANRAVIPVLRIGLPTDLSVSMLPPVLALLNAGLDAPRLALSTDSPLRLEAAFERGELDIAIVRRRPGTASGREIELWREPLQWITSPTEPWAGEEIVPLILQNDPCRCRELAMPALRDWGGPWTIAHTASSVEAIWAAVRAGLGVTPLPSSTCPRDLSTATQGRLPTLPDIAFVGLAGGPREAEWLVRLVGGLRAERERLRH